MVEKKKDRALLVLKKKKLVEGQLSELGGLILNLETTVSVAGVVWLSVSFWSPWEPLGGLLGAWAAGWARMQCGGGFRLVNHVDKLACGRGGAH